MKNSEILEKRHSEQVKKYIFGGLFGGSQDISPVDESANREFEDAKKAAEDAFEEYRLYKSKLEEIEKELRDFELEREMTIRDVKRCEDRYYELNQNAMKIARGLGIDYH